MEAPVVEEVAQPNRALTTGEIALLRPIFRDGIDYVRVRVINNSFPLQPANVYMTPRGHVYAPDGLWSDDFSAASRGVRAVFVHEMTHVWQFANGMDLIGQGVVEFTHYRGQYEKAYPYELARDRDLVEYGMEQQASIIEDYYVIMVDHDRPHRITNAGLSDPDRDQLYAAVMKNFLGNARYARALDPATVAGQHAVSSERTQPGPDACRESEQEHGAAHMCTWRFTPRDK
ncbi:hypothetical protein BH11MYX3_BH11MYX3_00370 [soil metagenome]